MRLPAALFILFVAATAQARPGGGHSFSSGSSYSSGGSSGGGSSWGSSGSSWGSSRSSSGSSWGSSGSSWGSSGSSHGSSPAYTGPAFDDSYMQSQMDESQCILECFQPLIMMDGGTDDCQQRCRARKATERAALERAMHPPPPPAPDDPPVSRSLMPVTLILAVIAIGACVSWGIRRRSEREWATWAAKANDPTSVDFRPPPAADWHHYASIEQALAEESSQDKGFSRVLLDDFLYALYAEVHAARGGNQLARVAPYLGDNARLELSRWSAEAVVGIIVGSAVIREVSVDPAKRTLRVHVAFETNYTERKSGAEQSYYAREEWVLERPADKPSRAPDRARVIGCASCGAPLDKIIGGSCSHCGTPGSGVADWRVVSIPVFEREARGPILTGTTEEQGTDLPTVVAPDAKERWDALCARDSALTWDAMIARVTLIFQTFHRTWAAQDLTDVRPFLSDLLFETQRYWVAAYKGQGLRNVTEDPTIVTIQISKVTSDPYFDALTVRVFATCKDYTVDGKGNLVGGARERERHYTEYWTLIRSRKATGAPRAVTDCPNCGAPASSIGMAGTCGSCNAKITAGDFDWVLSRIEQDEVYKV